MRLAIVFCCVTRFLLRLSSAPPLLSRSSTWVKSCLPTPCSEPNSLPTASKFESERVLQLRRIDREVAVRLGRDADTGKRLACTGDAADRRRNRASQLALDRTQQRVSEHRARDLGGRIVAAQLRYLRLQRVVCGHEIVDSGRHGRLVVADRQRDRFVFFADVARLIVTPSMAPSMTLLALLVCAPAMLTIASCAAASCV